MTKFMAKITYTDKVALNVNSEVADINKCNAGDLNEIKTVVNTNDTNALYKSNIKTSKTTSSSNTYSCTYVNTIDSAKLDKTSVKTSETTSDSDVYSCNYVNSIIESGSNDNGKWIKFADGTMICTKKHTGTATIKAALGNIFYAGYYAMAGDLPQNFIEAPYYYATNVENEWEIWATQFSPVTATSWATRIDIMSATAQTNKPITINMIAIGRWK